VIVGHREIRDVAGRVPDRRHLGQQRFVLHDDALGVSVKHVVHQAAS
jgi:hypothetical protein